LGIAGSSGHVIPVSEINGDGVPVINRSSGFGFRIVVEAAPGITGSAVGQTVLNTNASDPSALPDLQVQSSRDLGNASREVCTGGVPGIDPPRYGLEQIVADAMNDFACRFGVATTDNAS